MFLCVYKRKVAEMNPSSPSPPRQIPYVCRRQGWVGTLGLVVILLSLASVQLGPFGPPLYSHRPHWLGLQITLQSLDCGPKERNLSWELEEPKKLHQ